MTVFLKSIKTFLIFGVLSVALVFLGKPETVKVLERTQSNEEVERLVNERWNRTRDNPLINSSFFRGANMGYHGSRVVGLKEGSYLGTYVFQRGYNSQTGEIDFNKTRFTPSPLKTLGAFLIFGFVYGRIFPSLKARFLSRT